MKRFTRNATLALALAALTAGPAGAGVRFAASPETLVVAPGATFTIQLRVPVAGSAFNGYDAVVEYDPAKLTFLPTSPTSLQLPRGVIRSIVVTGTFSDTSTQPLSEDVQWTSADPTIAEVSNEAGSRGDASRAGQGSAAFPENRLAGLVDQFCDYLGGLLPHCCSRVDAGRLRRAHYGLVLRGHPSSPRLPRLDDLQLAVDRTGASGEPGVARRIGSSHDGGNRLRLAQPDGFARKQHVHGEH